jgi:hypothetical protein
MIAATVSSSPRPRSFSVSAVATGVARSGHGGRVRIYQRRPAARCPPLAARCCSPLMRDVRSPALTKVSGARHGGRRSSVTLDRLAGGLELRGRAVGRTADKAERRRRLISGGGTVGGTCSKQRGRGGGKDEAGGGAGSGRYTVLWRSCGLSSCATHASGLTDDRAVVAARMLLAGGLAPGGRAAGAAVPERLKRTPLRRRSIDAAATTQCAVRTLRSGDLRR